MNNYSWLKPGKNFPWRNPEFHRLIWDGEKYDLIKEFEQMFNILDKEKWRKDLNLNNIDETVLEWPYIKKEEL